MSINSITQNIFLEMVRGDTLGVALEIANLSATISEVTMTCRPSYGSPTVVFSGSLTGGEVTVDNGRIYICIPPSATESVTPGMYVYDIEIESGSDVYTPMIGNLRIIYGVTEDA